MSVFTSRCAIVRHHIKHLSNFHPLEVVGRGSETQLQVGENWNKTTQQAED